MATLRTLVIKLIQRVQPPNIKAHIDLYQDDFQLLINDLSQIGFL